MKGTLYIQLSGRGKRYKKPTPIERCKIDLARDGLAIAEKEGVIVAKMIQAQVILIARDGLLLCGIIKSGNDPYPVLRHQEWWFVPTEEKDEE